MKTLSFAMATLSLMAVVGCTSTPQTATEITKDELQAQDLKNEVAEEKAQAVLASVPRWVINPPKPDATGVYGVGIGQSSQLQLAMKKSSLNAQYELAKSIGQELSGNEQSYVGSSSSGTTEQYTQLIDSLVAETPLQGFELVQQALITLDGEFTSYQLMKLSYKQFSKSLQASSLVKDKDDIDDAFAALQQRLALKNDEIENTESDTNTR